MKKQLVHVLGCSTGLLAALLLSLTLLGMETRVAAAQGIAQQMPMTGTMPMSRTMPMSGTMPGVAGMPGMGQMGDMSAMLEMMKNMDARMTKMEARMAQMQGSMPMTGTMSGMGGMMGQGGMSGMGGMMGQGGMSGMMNSNQQQMHMMMQMMMMQMMMQMMDESGSMACPMMGEGGMGSMGGMMGQGGMGGMMGQGGMGGMMGEGGMGGMMGQGGMMSPPAGGEQAEHPADHTAGPMPGASAAEAHSSELGGISVKVTPANLEDRSGETLDFSVDLEAQGQALDFDVAKLAKLMVGSQEVAASGWKVNFDHGHHVNGTLSFPRADVAAALTPGTKIMLHISQPDGAGQAMFDWEVKE